MNESDYITFHKYTTQEEAYELLSILKEANISCYVENASPPVDITFSSNTLNNQFVVKVLSSSFEKANSILEDYAKNNLSLISKDHYLYDFNDEELLEILKKYDEWSKEDYLLAQNILKERQLVSDADIIKFKQQRISQLQKPEKANMNWIIAGYIIAILGGIIGAFIGWFHWKFKKIDPNGKRIYVYDEVTRIKGKYLFWFGLLTQVCWIIKWLNDGFF